MLSACLIEHLLSEAADLDKGLIGLDLELIIRGDLDPQHNEEVYDLFDSWGFNSVVDSSVTARRNSYERFYTDFEFNTKTPVKWSVLKQSLAKLFAWGKREDMVYANPSKQVPSQKSKATRARYVHLPRARVPSNFSAATHLHFDSNTWFEGPEHAQSFIKVFNAIQSNLPKYLPKGRYSGGDDIRGSFYASVRPNPAEFKFGEQMPKTARDFFSTFQAKSTQYGIDRYMALNLMPTASRGDVEFRFIHSTMSVDVVENWFKFIAELILYTNTHKGEWGDFTSWLEKEAPETSVFLAKQHSAHKSSQDPIELQRRPTKTMQKFYGLKPAAEREVDELVEQAEELLRREFNPESSSTSSNIIRTREEFKEHLEAMNRMLNVIMVWSVEYPTLQRLQSRLEDKLIKQRREYSSFQG